MALLHTTIFVLKLFCPPYTLHWYLLNVIFFRLTNFLRVTLYFIPVFWDINTVTLFHNICKFDSHLTHPLTVNTWQLFGFFLGRHLDNSKYGFGPAGITWFVDWVRDGLVWLQSHTEQSSSPLNTVRRGSQDKVLWPLCIIEVANIQEVFWYKK